ncbi:MAG: hypothetical protein VXY91_07415 [Bacteroidota bacterium]|nr:hypothetical protein [Bacteroidota bacterium]
MKQITLSLALLTVLSASAQNFNRPYGVGMAIGEPSGFSVKKFNNTNQAFQFTLGYSTTRNSGINLGVDFLLHDRSFITTDKGYVPLYYGFGAHIKSYESESQVYARVPLGVAYEFNNYPADIFFEFSPGVAVIPSPELVINVGVGGRFYFYLRSN